MRRGRLPGPCVLCQHAAPTDGFACAQMAARREARKKEGKVLWWLG